MNAETHEQEWIHPDKAGADVNHRTLTGKSEHRLRVLHLTTPGQDAQADRVILQGVQALQDIGTKVTLGILGDPTQAEVSELYLDQARLRGIPARLFQADAELDDRLITQLHLHQREAGYDIAHSHGGRALAYSLLSRGPSLALATSLHEAHLNQLRLRGYERVIRRMALNLLDRIFVETLENQAYLLTRSISATKVALVENMLDDELDRLPLAIDPTPNEPLRLLYMGPLQADSGILTLLEAVDRVRQHTEIRLEIVGDGSSRAELELAVRHRNLAEQVRFWGNQADYHRFVRLCHVLVLPMRRIGLPLSLIEAVACGKPVISSRAGGVSQLVEHEFNGLLVPHGDTPRLTEALDAIRHNYARFQRNSFLASNQVLQRYSGERWARTLEVHYNQIRQPEGRI